MPDILAIGNDWGTTDVESVIFHQVDAAILPLVIFDEPSTGDNFFAPQAIYDPIATDMETAVTLDVSANDTDLDGNLDATSVVIVQSASHGSVVNNGDGTVTYTPDVGWYGGDTIVYNISDTFGLVSNNATIGVMVNGTSNTIPTANFDSAATVLGVAVIIDVMANDTDADGDALDASSVAVNAQGNKGTAVVNGDGTITYTPAPSHQFGLNSTDSFTYTVNDVNGGVSNIATVELKLTLGGSTIR
jgi:VCBS repeat-containing protein